jgi:hypothetical protein
VNDSATVVQLRELLVALDNRHVQPSRPEEAAIAKDALEMRGKAVARLAELEVDSAAPSIDD